MPGFRADVPGRDEYEAEYADDGQDEQEER